MGIKENKLDVIVENESKSFVKDYVGVEKILEDFNNKRFYQFCKVGSFASKLDKKEIARAKRDLRKSIQKKKPTISKSYLNDTFRVFTPKLHEKIIKKNSSVEMVKAQLEKAGITNYEDFKYFMKPPAPKKTSEEKSTDAKEKQESSLESKMKDKSQIRSEEQNIAFVLEFVEEKFSDKSAVLLAKMILKKHGETDAKQELKTATK